MSELLRTSGLTRHFGGVTAVDDVDFAIGDDELCSLIGPNGAGKTTFFDLLTGALAPSEGTVEFRDGGGWRDLTDAALHETAAAGIHRSYQITNVFPTSTVLENVRVAAQAGGDDGGLWGTTGDSARLWRNVRAFDEYYEEALSILERVGLADEADTVAETLSHGEKRQLELAIALAGDPDLLLLDEPAAGVSSESVGEVIDLVREVATDHAVLLVEHNMDVVMDLSERVVVLHQGQIIADDDPEAVRENDRVQEAYLGGYGADDATAGSEGDADEGVGA